MAELEGHCDAFDHIERWQLLTPFDFTKIVRADARPLSHDFAGEVRCLPDGSHSATEKNLIIAQRSCAFHSFHIALRE